MMNRSPHPPAPSPSEKTGTDTASWQVFRLPEGQEITVRDGGRACVALSRRSLLILALGILLLLGAAVTRAQEPAAVTDDQVNAIARKMFCPVCPNEPLDTCMTEACVRWREDIRTQLAAGRTEDQIIADFVARYGERAAATPLDPTLRGLSVYVPWLIAGLALVVGVVTFLRWRSVRRPPASVNEATTAAPVSDADADYRATLERDLKE